MNADTALAILTGAFPYDGTTLDLQENDTHLFSGDTAMAATSLDHDVLRLSCRLPGFMASGSEASLRRLLEAGYLGLETGAGTLAADPTDAGAVALVDMVLLQGMSPEAFQQRVIDFLIYAAYWTGEGAEAARADAASEVSAAGLSRDETVIRV